MRAIPMLAAMVLPALLACAPQQPTTLEPTGGGATSSGAGAGGSPSTSEARAYFDANVQPIFVGTCADCHSNPTDEYGAPDFLGIVAADYYDQVTARTDFVSCDIANSILLSKGTDPAHAGPALTSGQHDKVTAWLGLEAGERFGGTCAPEDPSSTSSTSTGGESPPPLTGEEAMKQFGECMTLADWIDTGMPEVARQKAKYNGNQVPCSSCHANGTGENWMPDPGSDSDVADAFESMRWMYASFNLVRWTVNNEDGSFKDLVPSYRWRDKGQEGTSHPPYELSAIYLGYYEDWFDRTKQKWVSGACDGAGGGGGSP